MNSISRFGYHLVFILIACGCAQPASRHDQLSKTSAGLPPLDRLTDNYEWAKRLMASPAADGVSRASAVTGNAMTLPVAVPRSVAAQGIGFAMVVDNSLQLAWLQSYGGESGTRGEIHGPWKLDHPDVAHLLHSITIPPTQSAAGQ